MITNVFELPIPVCATVFWGTTFSLFADKLEISLNIYILLKFIFGREGRGCLGHSVQGPVKLDALKAFDRVSQHRQYDPRLFPTFAHIFHLTYPWALTSSIHYINSMLMHVSVQPQCPRPIH